jgi:HEAT repeat protein
VDDVALLAEKATADSTDEKQAAQRSLVRLRAEGIDQEIVSLLTDGRAEVRAELLRALAARHAKEAIPAVLDCATDPDSTVSLAALDALRYLADAEQTEALATIVKKTENEVQRRKAALALLAVCSRGREKCIDSIAAAMEDADESSRIVLLRALARCGGPTALESIAKYMQDDSQAVRDETVRMLSIWPNASAAHYLNALAQDDTRPRYQILAIRGLVRLASPQEEKLADVNMLAEALQSATRAEEKVLALGVLGRLESPEAMAAALAALDDTAVADEAGLAVTLIAARIEGGDQDRIRAALEKVLERVQTAETRHQAQDILDSL